MIRQKTLMALLTTSTLLGWAMAPVAQAVPCAKCFSVFVMPDTQHYTTDVHQPAGAAHLDLITRYVCANRTAWTEPSTGKEMPILMLAHLGDIVQDGPVEAEWQRADAAFDNLDACNPVVPYFVVVGNHDYDSGGRYYKETAFFNQYFGANRWGPYQCADPARCDWGAGEWFIGGGDPILADSRNNLDAIVGPNTAQPARHRVALIRAPNGQRFLFLGLELAFDFPPSGHPSEGDDSAWVKQVLNDHPGVPTVLVQHSLLMPDGAFDTDNFFSDSITTMQDLWDELVDPFPQVLMTLNGHHLGVIREADWVMPTSSGLDVFSLFRNYQGTAISSYGNGGQASEGDGWNVVLVFDPDLQQIRARSYRIEDVDDDGSHDGPPAATANLDMDFLGRPEQIFSYAFPDTRPASLDNCPAIANPGQEDANQDGVGDACTVEVPTLGASHALAMAVLLISVVLLAGALLRAKAPTSSRCLRTSAGAPSATSAPSPATPPKDTSR